MSITWTRSSYLGVVADFGHPLMAVCQSERGVGMVWRARQVWRVDSQSPEISTQPGFPLHVLHYQVQAEEAPSHNVKTSVLNPSRIINTHTHPQMIRDNTLLGIHHSWFHWKQKMTTHGSGGIIPDYSQFDLKSKAFLTWTTRTNIKLNFYCRE